MTEFKEGLLSKLSKFCKEENCTVEFNTESQCYEVIPKPSENSASYFLQSVQARFEAP